jgi:hypothetical protein
MGRRSPRVDCVNVAYCACITHTVRDTLHQFLPVRLPHTAERRTKNDFRVATISSFHLRVKSAVVAEFGIDLEDGRIRNGRVRRSCDQLRGLVAQHNQRLLIPQARHQIAKRRNFGCGVEPNGVFFVVVVLGPRQIADDMVELSRRRYVRIESVAGTDESWIKHNAGGLQQGGQ